VLGTSVVRKAWWSFVKGGEEVKNAGPASCAGSCALPWAREHTIFGRGAYTVSLFDRRIFDRRGA